MIEPETRRIAADRRLAADSMEMSMLVYDDSIPIILAFVGGRYQYVAMGHHEPLQAVRAADWYARMREGEPALGGREAALLEDWLPCVRHQWARLVITAGGAVPRIQLIDATTPMAVAVTTLNPLDFS